MTHQAFVRISTAAVFMAWISCAVICSSAVHAQDDSNAKKQKPDDVQLPDGVGDQAGFSFELSDDVKDVLVPMMDTIKTADVSRVTVEMLADSLMSGQVIDSRESTFQIAAKKPGKFTIYLKEPDQRTRVFCDGEEMLAAMSPVAYFRMPEVISIQEAVLDLPLPLGPYPEPLLALSLASCDPSLSLVGGMKSIELVDQKPFRKIKAIHLRGVQADGVVWDLWVSDKGTESQPLRLLTDLTPMLQASKDVHVPAGYSFQVRYDFLTWRMSGEVDDSLFEFKPAEDAKEYKSLQDYFEQIAGTNGQHPMLGKPAPAFLTKTIAGEAFDSRKLKGKVLVIDFWASWCEPCKAVMPLIQKTCQEFSDRGVVLLPVNTGESTEAASEFMEAQKFEMPVYLDEQGKVADGYRVEGMPQTFVIGKNGVIESIHMGYPGEEALTERLRDELEILVAGGKIASAAAEPVGEE